ncbi:MAG: hypothetical protein ACI9MC_001628 [Kiritimatiellia bacterium]|jgi:hypothetical protein
MSAVSMSVDEAVAAVDSLRSAGRVADAAELCRQILGARPGRVDVRVRLAHGLAAMGELDQAREQATLAVGASCGADLRMLGETWLMLGELSASVAAFVRGLGADAYEVGDAERLVQTLNESGCQAEAGQVAQGLQVASDKRYQRNVEVLRAGRYLDYPTQVHMETMARCNARCTFCPSPVLERSGTRMDDALISKIIEDLTDVPRDLPFQVLPFKVNEPFLDVRLFDILDSVNDRLPHAGITLTSNASALTDKKLLQLGRVKNLSKLYISFNDHRKEVYEATMGLPFERTVRRLDALHRAVARGELALAVVLSRVSDTVDGDVSFRAWCADRWPRFRSMVLRRGDWLGQVSIATSDVPDLGCVRWFEMSITATGTVAHCCMDGQAKWPIGDVREQHVLDIYNEPGFKRLRTQAVTRMGLEPCGTCTFR